MESKASDSPGIAQNPDALSEALTRRGHVALSWDEIEPATLPNGVVAAMYRIGLPDQDRQRGDKEGGYTLLVPAAHQADDGKDEQEQRNQIRVLDR